MKTHVIVYIECSEMDLRDYRAFERAAEFTRYGSCVTINCDNGQSMMVSCHPDGEKNNGGHTCWGWRWFKNEWERRYGPL